MLGQAGKQHQVERVVLRIAADAEIISKQKNRLAERNGNAQLHHHPLIGWRSIDDRKKAIGLLHVTHIGTRHLIRPTRLAQINLVIALKGLPHLGT